MTHEINLFRPPEATWNGYGIHRSNNWTPLATIMLLTAIWTGLANIWYLTGCFAPDQPGGESTYSFSWLELALFNLPLLNIPVAIVGRATHLYEQIGPAKEYALRHLKTLPLEYQAELGGKNGLLRTMEHCSSPEIVDIVKGMQKINESIAAEKEIIRKAQSQAPHVLEKLQSIRNEREAINAEYRRALE